MIHTASFFEEWNFGKKGRLVSIGMTTPDWLATTYSDREIVINEKLQPDWNMINDYKAGLLHPDNYKKRYMKLLYSRLGGFMLDVEYGRMKGKKVLDFFGIEDEDTLLCWEKHGRFCHRQIIAELLRKNGIDVVRK